MDAEVTGVQRVIREMSTGRGNRMRKDANADTQKSSVKTLSVTEYIL